MAQSSSSSSGITSGCSSSCYYGSPSYSTSQGQSLMQRSVSSHTLEKKKNDNWVPRFMSAYDFLDLDIISPVRRVFRTGDLHRINEGRFSQRAGSPLGSESSIIIEGMMNSACPYSPEEKKERIERYRSKRTRRNFNKRIKYECRKTLADNRPRIRGRFARSQEIEKKNPQVQSNHFTRDEVDDDDWINYLDSVSSANLFS